MTVGGWEGWRRREAMTRGGGGGRASTEMKLWGGGGEPTIGGGEGPRAPQKYIDRHPCMNACINAGAETRVNKVKSAMMVRR